VRFTHEDGQLEPVRAWVRRPQAVRIERLDGQLLHAEPGVSSPTAGGLSVSRLAGAPAGAPEADEPATPVWWTDRAAPGPARDIEGLVVEPLRLPPWVWVDDAMWQTYRWVAMLNPRELADSVDGTSAVEVDASVEGVRHSRTTLWATVRPREGYDPRCSCCPLLPCREAVLAEGVGDPDGSFADAHRVALDVATGVCVSTREVGGPAPGRGFDVLIEAVDEPVPDDWFTPPPRASGDEGGGLGWVAWDDAVPGVAPKASWGDA